MTFIIFLIIVGFTNSAHLLILNNTVDEFEPMCNISLLRNKRAYTEYTRWRPNLQTTQEFIVKVLDDEMTTPKVNQIVAVNILPATKGTEKIIVGGVVVPSPTTAMTVEQQSEYTRFVPPTLMTVTRGHKDLFLAQAAVTSGSKIPPYPPKVITQNEPPYPQFKFGLAPQRDESPPASPQFVARTPMLLGRKYAPITPVVFTQKSTVTHLSPPTKERLTFPGTRVKPTRTSPLPDVIMPSRTTLPENDLHNFHNFEDEELKSNEIFMSRSTFLPLVGPERTNVENIFSVREKIAVDTSTFIDYTTEVRKMIEQKKKTKLDDENEFDSSYGIMFYNDDDKENIKSGHPNYKYKSEESIKQVNEDVNSTIVTNKENIDDVPLLEESEINTGSESDYEQDTLAPNQTVVAEANFAKESFKLFQETRHNCSLLRLRQLNFNSPRTLAEIVAQLKHWAENSPIAKWVDITVGNYTVMENPIYMMIVDDPSSGQIVTAKLTVMVIAGIQGRDHHAVSAALYVLYQLIERTEVHSDLLTKYRFWIIPVFNPDGYDYSMTFPQRREWTKNLRQTWDSSAGRDSCAIFGLRCSIKPCYGVNLDRNFEYQWIPTEELRAEHPCGELYAGARQLSEAETLALTRFLHSQQVPLHTFIAFKEGDVLGIMYPYSHTKKARAFDHVYRQRASRAASAAYSISGRPYVAGQTSQFLPLYAGGIEDWIDGHLGIDNTYTVMMFRPTDSYNSKLVTERVVHEAYAAMDTLLLQNVEPILGPPLVTLSKSKGIHHTLPFPISSVFCTSMLLIIIDTQITIRI